MKLSVDHKELNKVAARLEEDANALNQEFDNIYNNMDSLEKICQGYDSQIFCNKVRGYANHLKEIPEIYKAFNKIIKNADKIYMIFDNDYSNSLKKAVVENE